MKRLLSVLALSSALLLSIGIAWGRDLPWRTFSEANKALSGLTVRVCPAGPAYLSFHRVGATTYIFVSGEAPSRPLIVLYDPDPDGPNPPTEYGVGSQSTGSGDEIPPLRWAPMAPQFDPCAVLYPVVVPIRWDV